MAAVPKRSRSLHAPPRLWPCLGSAQADAHEEALGLGVRRDDVTLQLPRVTFYSHGLPFRDPPPVPVKSLLDPNKTLNEKIAIVEGWQQEAALAAASSPKPNRARRWYNAGKDAVNWGIDGLKAIGNGTAAFLDVSTLGASKWLRQKSGLDFVDYNSSAYKTVRDFSAGLADGVSFGITKIIRDQVGDNTGIDYNSRSYGAGKLAGVVASLFIPYGGLARVLLMGAGKLVGLGRATAGAAEATIAARAVSVVASTSSTAATVAKIGWGQWAAGKAVVSLAGGGFGLLGQGIHDVVKGKTSSWQEYAGSFGGGATGVFLGSFAKAGRLFSGLGGAARIGGFSGMAQNATTQYLTNGTIDMVQLANATRMGSVGGVFGMSVAGKILGPAVKPSAARIIGAGYFGGGVTGATMGALNALANGGGLKEVLKEAGNGFVVGSFTGLAGSGAYFAARGISKLAHSETAPKTLSKSASWLADALGIDKCFAAGTPIRTPDGSKLIELFRAGDLVLSRDENDPLGLVVAKLVEKVFVRHSLIWHLHVGGQVIRTTGEHPFYAEGKEWTRVDKLGVGDRLLCEDGTWVQVEDMLDTGEWETVYNLRIADYHTYFVGADEWGFAVWAHNACQVKHVGGGHYRVFNTVTGKWVKQSGNLLQAKGKAQVDALRVLAEKMSLDPSHLAKIRADGVQSVRILKGTSDKVNAVTGSGVAIVEIMIVPFLTFLVTIQV